VLSNLGVPHTINYCCDCSGYVLLSTFYSMVLRSDGIRKT
jgi:hypothetical protein